MCTFSPLNYFVQKYFLHFDNTSILCVNIPTENKIIYEMNEASEIIFFSIRTSGVTSTCGKAERRPMMSFDFGLALHLGVYERLTLVSFDNIQYYLAFAELFFFF